jgi:hypothetical protein
MIAKLSIPSAAARALSDVIWPLAASMFLSRPSQITISTLRDTWTLWSSDSARSTPLTSSTPWVFM